MASIRRTLSPVPRAGTAMNGEACLAGSPLSRSSNCSLSSTPLDSQAFVLDVFSPKNPKPAEKPKHNNKPQPWKRPIVQFSACFVVGIILGFTPFLSSCLTPKHQAFSFETVREKDLEGSFESLAGIYEYATGNLSSSKLEPRKLLIVVTPTQPGLSQAYRLNRLSHTLRLVPAPMLWIVVEMTAQSSETAGVLRKTGVMYRHLVCSDMNVTGDTSAHQRNVALKHIETHRLDGIVYFADDENVYSTDLFDQLRQIRRFGIWKVAKVVDDEQIAILDGPVCNGSEVIGWRVNEPYRRYQRFYAEMSGFAFNSTLLWDTERWHRPMLEPIRHRDKLKDNAVQVSLFIEQIVEDESQMEGLMEDCSRIMVWHSRIESANSVYPRDWVLKDNLDAVASLSSSTSS